jgi:glycosyltransferase involved in cell wall biosynthesis
MANARPVIATNVGGVVDLLGKVEDEGVYNVCERGVSVRPYDVDAFAAGLGRLIQEKEMRDRLGRRGFEFVDHNYRKERLLEDIKNLYGQLLNRERTANREVPDLSSSETNSVAKYS